MTQTQKYKLPQWEKADRIVMEDFNGMASKLETALTAHDTALAAKADKTTTTSLQTQVNARATTSALNSSVSGLQTQINAKCRLTVGAYIGNGQSSRTISLGFTPQAVLVIPRDSDLRGGYGPYGGLAVTGYPVMQSSTPHDTMAMEIVSGGFRVYEAGLYASVNASDMEYHYMALG